MWQGPHLHSILQASHRQKGLEFLVEPLLHAGEPCVSPGQGDVGKQLRSHRGVALHQAAVDQLRDPDGLLAGQLGLQHGRYRGWRIHGPALYHGQESDLEEDLRGREGLLAHHYHVPVGQPHTLLQIGSLQIGSQDMLMKWIQK